MDYGKIGYEAYAESTGGKTYDGRQMPAWDALPPHVQNAWAAAANSIITAHERTQTP